MPLSAQKGKRSLVVHSISARLRPIYICLSVLFSAVLFLTASTAHAQSLPQLVEKVRSGGGASSEEIVDELLRSPEDSLQLPAEGKRVLKSVPGFSQRLRAEATRRVREILRSEPPANATWLARIAREYLPEGDLGLVEIKNTFDVVESAEHLSATSDLGPLRDLMKLTPNDGDRKLVEARFMWAVHREADSQIEAGEPVKALQILSNISPEQTSETTEKMVSKAVLAWRSKLSDSSLQTPIDEWPLNIPAVRTLIEKVASSDPGVMQTLIAILEWRTLAAIAQKDVKTAADTYADILTRRPDPNEANNDFRMSIALEASGSEMRSFAVGRIEELKLYGALTATRKLRLLFAGYYGKTFLVLLAFCAALLVLAPIIGRYRPHWALPEVEISLPSLRLPHFKRKEKTVPGYMNPANQQDEYGSLLALFGLDDSADEEDIKSAYRAAIKLYHPDHIDPSDPNAAEVADRFRRIQSAYERIMAIRGSWFSGGR